MRLLLLCGIIVGNVITLALAMSMVPIFMTTNINEGNFFSWILQAPALVVVTKRGTAETLDAY